MDNTTGEVIFVLGNLIKVKFDNTLTQGEIGYVIENYLAKMDELDLPDDYSIHY